MIILLLVMFCKTNIDMIVLCCYLIKIIENKDCRYCYLLQWLPLTLMFSSYHGQNNEIQ